MKTGLLESIKIDLSLNGRKPEPFTMKSFGLIITDGSLENVTITDAETGELLFSRDSNGSETGFQVYIMDRDNYIIYADIDTDAYFIESNGSIIAAGYMNEDPRFADIMTDIIAAALKPSYMSMAAQINIMEMKKDPAWAL